MFSDHEALIIDCTEMDKKALLEAFAQAMGVPRDYVDNWDALYDALTERESPLSLTLTHGESSKLTDEERDTLEAVLEEAKEERGEAFLRLRLL